MLRLVVATLVGLGTAACDRTNGVTAEPTSFDTVTVSQEDYVERANALCRELAQEVRDLAEKSFAELGRAPTTREVVAYERQVVELQRQTLARLRALRPPPADAEAVGEIYDSWARLLDRLEALPMAERGRTRVGGAARFAELARSYGLTECAPQ